MGRRGRVQNSVEKGLCPYRRGMEARISLCLLRWRRLSGNPPLGERRRLTVARTQPRTRLPGLFHCNAGVAPLCRRKAATKRARLLCAAADASSLPYGHGVSPSEVAP